jgi:aerobic-type carbon monoxide dehydrogenase small subunit (CoxS/CutS family)
MHENLTIFINGQAVHVEPGTTVAAVLFQQGLACHLSVSGEPRSALCGMGICFECRVIIDGVPHRRACQTLCMDGMTVETPR